MQTDNPAAGPALLEPDIEENQQEPTPSGRRSGLYWPLVALVAVALSIGGAWALTQPRTADEVAEVAPRVLSDHDSGITMQLREREALQQGRPQHDAFLSLQQQEHEARSAVPPQHDSGIAAEPKTRPAAADGCVRTGRGVALAC